MTVLPAALPAEPAPEAVPGPTTAERMEAWRRRSHRVHFMRRWLPRIAVGLVAFTVLWMCVRGLSALIFAADYQKSEIHMINPKFLGRNERGQPYSVIAKDAVRDPRHPDRVHMQSPVMRLRGESGQDTVMVAKTGFLDQTRHLLDMAGDVDVFEPDHGYRFKSQRALIDTEGGAARGDTAVEGFGPLGRITASSYSISERGEHIVFQGNVHTHIIPDSSQRPPVGATKK